MRKIVDFFRILMTSKIAILTIIATIAILVVTKSILSIFGILLMVCLPFFFITAAIYTSSKRSSFYIAFIAIGLIIIFSTFMLVRKIPAMPYTFGAAYHLNTAEDVQYCQKHSIHNTNVQIKEVEYTSYESVLTRNGVEVETEYYYAIVQTSAGRFLLRYFETEPQKNSTIRVYFDTFSGVDWQVYKECSDGVASNAILISADKYIIEEHNFEKGTTLLWAYALILSCFIGMDGIKRFRNHTYYSQSKAGKRSAKTWNGSSTNDGKNKLSEPLQMMAEGICYSLENKRLSKYLLKDFTTDIMFTYGDIGSKKRMEKKLNSLFFEMLKYLNLPPFIELIIEYEGENSSNAAGEYKRKGDEKKIVLRIKSDYGPNHIVAILCHECTHYFMEYNDLNWNDTGMNEVRTDVMTNLIGFNRILIEGYKKIIDVQTQGNFQTTRTQKIGYITENDCANLRRILLDYRSQVGEREARLLKQKQKLDELRNLLDTATTLNNQLHILDPRNNKNEDIQTKAQIDNLSWALYEYGGCDLDKEIQECYNLLENSPSSAEIESAISSVRCLCENMARWSAAFQGKPI